MFKKYITIKLSEVVKTARLNGVGVYFKNTNIYVNGYPFNSMFDGDRYLYKKDKVRIIEFYVEGNINKKREFTMII
jgi:uncharacterized protein (UPF0276 family)